MTWSDKFSGIFWDLVLGIWDLEFGAWNLKEMQKSIPFAK